MQKSDFIENITWLHVFVHSDTLYIATSGHLSNPLTYIGGIEERHSLLTMPIDKQVTKHGIPVSRGKIGSDNLACKVISNHLSS